MARARPLIIAAIVFSALLVLFFGVKKEETKMPRAIVGLDAPELMVRDASGKSYTLKEMNGSVVFINFWATWCQPCREELPSIQTLYNQFRNERGFRMVTVLYRDDYQKASAYLKERNFELPVMIDDREKTARAYGVTGVPETYIVGKNGVLKDKVIGPADWGSPQAISRVSGMIKE